MKITYIHHSCFSVELDKVTLLFDYFKGDLPKFDKDKKLYVFSSHQHHDHFNSIIFDLEKEYKNIKYILSNDINCRKSENTVFVGPNEDIEVDRLRIRTLESTDLGVAFIITLDGKTLYHAGDLNWWHWEGENTDAQNKDAGDRFKHEMKKLKDKKVDVAFLPLDSRQGEQFYLGFNEFMNMTDTKYAFPMHFWRTYSIIDKLKEMDMASSYKDRVVKINKENEVFEIEL
ncbi:MBL fold metallo-hydrolase [Romboutsia sp. Marseille-P6047]|uniref:MBL fold metallo-hydrolase n=1 Tax=Romboutsia sp. Marseille-P6047 TaxID=2161817 RepID=UPI000F05BB8E|nr:MBL fold metallo-hydrolase [Romboutsia sp. Marseille-P6047]